MALLPRVVSLVQRRHLGILALVLAAAGCAGNDDGLLGSVDAAPVIAAFSVDRTIAFTGETIAFRLDALDDAGLDSAVVTYGDSTRSLLILRGRRHLSATITRSYDSAGVYQTALSVYDTHGQSAFQSLGLTVVSR